MNLQMIRIAVCVVALCLVGVEALGTVQSAAVRGVLKCNGVGAENVKVKLYDVDTLDPDDLMDEGLTDSEGRFLLRGHETEVTTIEPKLNVYNTCKKDNLLPCPKKFSIRIPDDYISEGSEATKTFDVGELNLNGEFGVYCTVCIKFAEELIRLNKMIPLRLLLLILIQVCCFNFGVCCFGRVQSIAVKGQLLCDNRPATSAVIRLYDEDFPDADDLLSEGYVDRFGYFYITGRAVEFLTINPYLSILHECDDLIVPCMKRVVVSIPSEYVSNGDLPIRIYDAGQFNLNGYFPGQDRECIH
ncbi:hypothetical protein M3Y94_01056500 [Aphelenchoides besseyi]|nr:hypothetical protein M3Y94_01056500 [Aphelenchoides besseyi]